MQDGLAAQRGNPFGQRSPAYQMRGMISVIAVMDLPADDLAAIQVEDEVEVKPLALHLGW